MKLKNMIVSKDKESGNILSQNFSVLDSPNRIRDMILQQSISFLLLIQNSNEDWKDRIRI